VAQGRMHQIVNGKLGPMIHKGGITFRSPELWKSLVAIGGDTSQRHVGCQRIKGQPWQQVAHTVRAVPGKITNVRVIDAMQRA